MNEFERRINDAWEEYRTNKANELYPNIMLLGFSGAGKSSLVNRIFGADIAKVSDVKPETQGFENIYFGKDYGMSVNIIDTAGCELSQGETYYHEVHKRIVDGVKGQPVHIIWYCIAMTEDRVQPIDVFILNKLMEEESIRKRVCIVFTKRDEDSEKGEKVNVFREVINEDVKYKVPMFETTADVEYQFDIDKLIQWSADSIDEEDLKNKFIASQFIDLNAKKKQAQKVIGAAAAAAAAAGAIPFPFADSVVLVPIQVKMITSIIDVYGVTNLASISTSLVGDIIISQLGKSFAKTLVSIIPLVGPALNIATSTVNAAVASGITTAIGFAISEICYVNVKKYLKGETVVWDKIFDSDVVMAYVKNFKNNNDGE